jgi:AmmeMemoRadiSam system protein A
MTPLTESDQQTLLRIARESLEGYLQLSEIPKFPDPSENLRQPCGAFVSLHKGKNLRGCVGMIVASKPLYITVGECAVWAGLQDHRFPPVTWQEVGSLNFEISVLSPLAQIAPENIEVGRHGLVISQGGMRGLLLPQVALEWKWDREQFLEQTCRKAGLPPDAWRKGARIEAFTAQVFQEPQTSGSAHPIR